MASPQDQRVALEVAQRVSALVEEKAALQMSIADFGQVSMSADRARAIGAERKRAAALDAEIVALLRAHPMVARAVGELLRKQVPKRSLMASIATQRERFIATAGRGVGGSFAIDSSHQAGSQEAVVTTPLEQLEAVRLQDLLLYSQRETEVLLCRIVSACSAAVGISFVVEDTAGEAIMASVYNYAIELKPKALDAVFRVGRIMAWKAPNFKMSSIGSNVMLRCDNPANVQFVDDLSSPVLRRTPWFVAAPAAAERPPTTAASALDAGNEHARRDKWSDAVACYSDAIALDDSSSVHARRGRARAYFELGQFEEALGDAEAALKLDPQSVDTLVCKARSLYALGRYRDSAQAWIAAKADREEVGRALRAVKQSEQGVYDWRALAAQVLGDPAVELDCVTYLHPHVCVHDNVQGKGRGMFATGTIEKGTLILVEPALAVSGEWARFMVSFGNNRAETPGQVSLHATLMARASRNAAVRNQLAQLCTSGHGEVRADNAFALKVRAAIATCAWDPRSCLATGSNDMRDATALYYHGSLFNHSCLPNCVPSFLGNLMLMTTLQTLHAGDELTVSYVALEATLGLRREQILARGFDCKCPRCEEEAPHEKDLQRLQATLNELDSKFSDGVAVYTLPEARKAIARAQALRGASMYAASYLQCMCAASAERAQDMRSALKLWKKAMDGRDPDYVVHRANAHLIAMQCIKLAHLHRCNGQPEQMAHWNAMGAKWLSYLLPAELVQIVSAEMVRYYSNPASK